MTDEGENHRPDAVRDSDILRHASCMMPTANDPATHA
jgi:hypothetical protein